MTQQDKEQLKLEIDHIFESGANEIRIFEMVVNFIDSRNGVNKNFVLADVSFQLFQELYGSYVQMNDRFESVHIWSEELAIINKGRWTPELISKSKYEAEKLHSWNN